MTADPFASMRPASAAHVRLAAAVLHCQEAGVEPDTIRGFVEELLPPPTPDGLCPTCAGTHSSAAEFCSDAFHGPASPVLGDEEGCPDCGRADCHWHMPEIDALRAAGEEVEFTDIDLHRWIELRDALEENGWALRRKSSAKLGDEERERLRNQARVYLDACRKVIDGGTGEFDWQEKHEAAGEQQSYNRLLASLDSDQEKP